MADNSTVIPTKDNLSPIPKDLIEYLKHTFRPEVSAHHDLRDYDVMVGQQEVIGHIQTLYEYQKYNYKG